MTESFFNVPGRAHPRGLSGHAWLAWTVAFSHALPVAAQAETPCHAMPGQAAHPTPVSALVVALPDRRFASAYSRFVLHADRGDAAAASAALFMLRNGKALFGSDWSATEGQQARWNALAINAARYQMPAALEGTEDR
jgi:hypothetical protein